MLHVNFDGMAIDLRNVLVVDDMESNCLLLGRRLEILGYSVSCVDSGPATLAYVEHTIPDIILLDFLMPQMNGVEVLRELRAAEATRDVPVIMVTGRAESEATVEALEAGADDYVLKPIDFDVLRARIDIQLAKRARAENLKRANAALDERVTLRSMALADLEGELKEEIQRRHVLEQRVEQLAEGSSELAAPCSGNQLAELLAELDGSFEAICTTAATGQRTDLTQLAEFRDLLAKARASITA